MTDLVVVQGMSGAGKSIVGRYLESELGFARYEFDRYVGRLRYLVDDKESKAFHGLVRQLLGDEFQSIFWPQFWRDRGSLPYDMTTVKDRVRIHADKIRVVEELPVNSEDRFHIAYALWNVYFMDRDRSIRRGQSVVLDTLTGQCVSDNCLRETLGETRKYILVVDVDTEEAVRRNVQNKGWTEEKSRDRVQRSLGVLCIEPVEGAIVIRVDNNGDLETLKRKVVEVFTD